MNSPRTHEEYPPLTVPDKVTMIDIDGTLINANYHVTDDRIMHAVHSAQNDGWQIGLSSDTPYGSMKEWHRQFGMNGPIISEKGAFVKYDEHAVTTAKTPFDFIALRDLFLEQIKQADTVIYRGEPVQLLKSEQRIGEPGETVILSNEFREHSIGYFVRAVDEDGVLRIDEQKTLEYADQIRSLYPEDIEFDEDLNHSHGLMIVSHKDMHKRTGTLELSRVMGIGKIAMIGNSIADYVGDDIAVHLAVGDATPEYKNVADYVESGSATSGVVQALARLVDSNK